ncbi:Transcriptional regulator, TetR family OS=Tsukamurella paurometabola (strain ATCC 8368 / DSM/ CCUG 35730 / CIP 100753 / JCM 10117 / KCTC 9821 / NBRC 16120/ NCIMB 702349 / NCTC 13040) OX=521096 GN=Tpau_3500 PE=4 SV=1 [Tsukamurella paurometabola]|uniref:Transcriptional regulator, TetR family n=1 Tax=Tsukamurella paurometabola (strain ATCC 8368 / DSM 20162 / CCUG 35730 / CIP 100753 / JCM 10117 / KCTC 9821 / NBRC 16120 / NCIMB 702349 / NCTC 13040) TaxID=521096 RepID=D5UX60_TSUPD|nr:TetR/AcrR family transcriptional regulator [Tsukamurella paurometabola]ADG80079.1 transcriptional regulator, TetR family [Tsukamurella paurometabola DSM 20162]SUP38336.1 Solvent efflux pump srpABC operon corepressor [Tsukamurella paurometabola]
MGRPVDHARRAQLLDAAVDVVVAHGLADLSLRPLAASLGVSTSTLTHHFGSKEQLVQAVLDRIRNRLSLDVIDGEPGLPAAFRRVWRYGSAPENEAYFRTFYAAYGQALQHPDRFDDFLGHVVDDWRIALAAAARRAPGDTAITLAIATFRGLLLDLLTTGDRERVCEAADRYAATLPLCETDRRV